MSLLRGRTRDSSWQWLVIGVVLGLGCSSVTCLGGYALGFLRFNVPGSSGTIIADAPTPTLGPSSTAVVLIITATPAPTSTNLPVTSIPVTAAVSIQQAATAPVVSGAGGPTPFVVNSTSAAATQSVSSQSAVTAPTAAPVGTNLVGGPTAVPPDNSGGTPASGIGITLAAPGTQDASSQLTLTDMVNIPGGIFKMGTTAKEATQAIDDCTTRDKAKCTLDMTQDSIPEHDVTIDSFQIEKYTVSYAQYVAYLNTLSDSYKTACEGEPCVALQDNNQFKGSYIKQEGPVYKITTELYLTHPVAFVTWYGADAYCKAIGRRLPTEAEYERAARSNDKRIYPWGPAWDATKANTNRPPQNGTLPVDSYPTGVSNEGVFNLSGNVAQWVSDWYDPNYYKSSDASRFLKPKGPASGQQKIIRGGSWDEPPFFARAVQRQTADPGQAAAYIGFRCAADGSANGGSPSTNNNSSSGGVATAAVPAGLKPTLHP